MHFQGHLKLLEKWKKVEKSLKSPWKNVHEKNSIKSLKYVSCQLSLFVEIKFLLRSSGEAFLWSSKRVPCGVTCDFRALGITWRKEFAKIHLYYTPWKMSFWSLKTPWKLLKIFHGIPARTLYDFCPVIRWLTSHLYTDSVITWLFCLKLSAVGTLARHPTDCVLATLSRTKAQSSSNVTQDTNSLGLFNVSVKPAASGPLVSHHVSVCIGWDLGEKRKIKQLRE
jgi:hypothetical protein